MDSVFQPSKRAMIRIACLLVALALPLFASATEPVDFAGTWSTNWGLLVLKAVEGTVSGKYTGQFAGSVEGKVEDDGKLHYTWKQTNGEWGSGVFSLSDDGQKLKGTWGGMESKDNGGEWNGERES